MTGQQGQQQNTAQVQARIQAAGQRVQASQDRLQGLMGGTGFRTVVDALVQTMRDVVNHELAQRFGLIGQLGAAAVAPLESQAAAAADRALGGTGTPDAGAVAAGDGVAQGVETVIDGQIDPAKLAAGITAMANGVQQLLQAIGALPAQAAAKKA